MSKHNVNPNHYKVAGRERQGEDILQARNKQKLAQSVVRERFEMRQAVPAGTSPADPSTFPSAPSVPGARQERGRAWRRGRVESPRCSASAQAGRHSPLAERRVYREEAIRSQHEDARHEDEDTIDEQPREKLSRATAGSLPQLRWKEGVQRWSEESLRFPTEVIRRREEAPGAAASRRRATRSR